ncbi:glycosyltransferase 1 domain-containing protein 1 [Scleropages formosus]|uniref:Glycosyltransferase 1 domain containing 1 n=2 Tax=Scleropages formosus TaxID=113540 RepID=A0A8C9R3M7_SCLFO|nr:glycosyltransferase 1 domain-containing protein 1 [Scleropages formosus]
MKLLLLACLSPHTGNCTTAQRIRGHVESAGHTCILRDVTNFQSPGDVAVLLSRETPFDGLLAIHLYKGGRLLLGSQVPYGIIFGGTDINEDVKDATKRAVMEQVLEGARFAVAFSTKMKEDAERLWPSSASKVHVQPQGIMTNAAPGFCWSDFLRSAGVRDAGEDLRVFLLVCGLRRVKDPLYLVEAFSEWHCEEPSVVLVIIGPKMDPIFSVQVEEKLRRAAGVFLAPERSREELHAALQRSFALVNSSISEGMSAAILEAMDLGVPVVVRDVPGNAAIVRHEETGLLYSSPQEFVSLSKRLLGDGGLLERLVANGRCYIQQFHSISKEREGYQQFVELLR